MIELLLSSAALFIGEGSGIKIQGFNGTGITRSAGVTKVGNVYNFAGAGSVDWLMIPGAGTIDIGKTPPDIEITIDFMLRNFPTNYHTLWGRADQLGTPFGWQLICNSTGLVRFQTNHSGIWLTEISLNTRHQIKVTRISGVWNIYIDDVHVGSLNYTASESITHNWTFGTYLSGSNTPIIGGGVQAPVNWIMYSFEAKEIS